ncbi:hypothetical protein GCM10022205_33020 [Spinactinospora alkalitolerans]
MLEPGRIISTDQLVDVIWESSPPETARTQVQICISRLRKLLKKASGDARIVTQSPGYFLQLDSSKIDSQIYARLVADADTAARKEEPEEALRLVRKALALWRGPALKGITSGALRAKATRLDEDWLSTVEKCFSLELALGRHHQSIGELRELVEQYPLRERFRAQLILALHWSGRRAEALETYRSGRELLVAELGLEPGPELRSLEKTVLTEESTPKAAGGVPGRPATFPGSSATLTEHRASRGPLASEPAERAADTRRPRQLPSDIKDFVGRDKALSQAHDELLDARTPGAANVVAFTGLPGIGKSTTAVRLAHTLVADHFPDGQLFCDMRGNRGSPVSPYDALRRILRTLGEKRLAVPAGLDERSALYRNLVAHRRILLVLDDVASEEQVIPLLPGSGTCAVLLTSRNRLTGPPGVRRIELTEFSKGESLELLSRVAGRERVAGDKDAATALAERAAHLPLTVRGIAAWLAARPHYPLACIANRLGDGRPWPNGPVRETLRTRAELAIVYDRLEPESRRALRMLGLTPESNIPAWVMNALTDLPGPRHLDILDALLDAHLLDMEGMDVGGAPRYRLPAIVRLFARDRLAAQETAQECRAATERMLGGWISLVDEANRRIHGGGHSGPGRGTYHWNAPPRYAQQALADPLTWVEVERRNLCSALAQASEHGLDELRRELGTGIEALGLFPGLVGTGRRARHHSCNGAPGIKKRRTA